MRMPNLNGLKAFEAAARLRSMKDAAEELHVSPSAVSQLIGLLEDELGVALFTRGHRRLALTSAGQLLMPAVANGFRLVVDAAERVRREPEGAILTVSTTAFFAETWLIPRLESFAAAFPAIDLQITSGAALASLRDGEADVAIRHGLGIYPGMRADLLAAPPVLPVAAPALSVRRGRPATPADLMPWPKLHDADRRAWSEYFAVYGLVDLEPARGPSFDDAALLAAAIRAGSGAGLLPEPAARALAEAGQVETLGQPVTINQLGYYLVTPIDALRRPLIAAFREWALKEAGA
jgi:LysR family glycine cleavage system transcriptional activator